MKEGKKHTIEGSKDAGYEAVVKAPARYRWLLLVIALFCLLQFQVKPLHGEGRMIFDTAQLPNACVNNSIEPKDQVHILYGLSGREQGTLDEFKVSMKSTLLNAPIDDNLHIHILTDDKANHALDAVFNETGLGTWKTRNQVTIQTYNIETRIKEWKQYLKQHCPICVQYHTFGAYFRLLAQKVLPTEVATHVLYMDTDVVVMGNLQELWKHKHPTAYFSWGEDRCSGFVILNLQRLDEMWDQFNNTYNHSSGETRFMDQDILRHINKKFPDEVSLLPLEYANALARVWKLKKNFVQHRPKVGMIHFNGGGFSKDVFWNNSGMMNLYPDTFGLPFYYIRMPWEWAKYFVEGHLGNGEGKDLIIRHDHNSHM